MSEKFKHTYRGYLVDNHCPKPPVVTLENLDPAEWEKFIVESNINQMTVYTKDHWGYSYYDTALGCKHEGLGDRDGIAAIAPVWNRHFPLITVLRTIPMRPKPLQNGAS